MSMTVKHRPRNSNIDGSLGINSDNITYLADQVQRGFSFQKLAQFHRNSLLPMDAITKTIQLPKRTLVRRKQLGKLSPAESERLLRLALVFDKATALFEGDKTAARDWLNTPNNAFGQVSPLQLTQTELGARAVEDLIGQLEHGVFV